MGPGNRPLDLDWLEDFVALADSGSFSRAAEARSIAQPAFSRHIRSLEDWVGAELFDRSAHPTELTPAGRKFQPLLEEILASLEAARIKARAAQAEAAASLRFAATHGLSMSFFPAWLSTLEAQAPVGPIHLMSDSLQACEDLMVQRRAQFLLCHAHPQVPGRADDLGMAWRVLARDTLVPVCVPALAAGQAEGSTDDPLAGRPLLGYSESSALGRILRAQVLPKRGAREAHPEVFTAHHALLLKAIALQGRGVAWLPHSVIAQELADGQLVAAADVRWTVPLEIRLYRQPTLMAACAEQLWVRLSEHYGTERDASSHG